MTLTHADSRLGGLYHPASEHDACGVGFVVDMKGRRSHTIVEQGLTILKNLQHRGACGCEENTGAGACARACFVRPVAGAGARGGAPLLLPHPPLPPPASPFCPCCEFWDLPE